MRRRLIAVAIALIVGSVQVGSIGAAQQIKGSQPASAQFAKSTSVAAAADNQNGLYTLDGWGGVHPVGSAPSVSSPTYFGWDIARGLVTRADNQSGYILDGFGGIHSFGGAPDVTGGPYWGWDIARGIVLRSDGVSGYVLDGYGPLHPFCGAPAVTGFPSFGWDIARGVALRADGVSGYVLDGWGGVHPFGGAPWLSGAPSWSGWDIARTLALNPSGGGGYVLDGWGGLHPIGNSLAATGGPSWAGWDIARGVVLWSVGPSTQPGGWVIDGWGGVHSFGGAPVQSGGASWLRWDIVRGLGGSNASGGSRHYNVPPPPPLTFGDGTWRVGPDIASGTYRTRQGSSGCYWERLRGFSGSFGDIIANDFDYGNQVVTIQPTDAGFHTSGCGRWTSDLSATGAWPTPDGVFIGGTDLSPGTYHSPGGSGCYWARLSGFSDRSNEIIANGGFTTSVIVTISPGDVGFETQSCGTWSPG